MISMKLRQLLCIATLSTLSVVAVAEPVPEATIKATTEDVLALIARTSDRQRLTEFAELRVVPHFDFRRMTRLAAGSAWEQASPEQQRGLEREFRTLLLRSYTTALAATKPQQASVEVLPARTPANAEEILVKTRVRADGGRRPVAIDYAMHRVAAEWKVFDVSVENISLVANYRSTFAAELDRGGVDGLLRALREKNQAATARAQRSAS